MPLLRATSSTDSPGAATWVWAVWPSLSWKVMVVVGTDKTRIKKDEKNAAFSTAKVLFPAPASKLHLDAGREPSVQVLPSRVGRQRRMVGGQRRRIVPYGRSGLHSKRWIGEGFVYSFEH